MIKDINDILFVIQARTNSERVPNKMMRPFADTCLFEIALQKVLDSDIPNENFIASVYEQSLADATEKYGLKTYRRSLSSNLEERDIRVMYEWYDKFPQYKYAIKINPCNLFLKTETINSFIKQYLNSESEGLFAVTSKQQYYWDEDGTLQTSWPEGYNIMNTKRVGTTLEAAHCLYAGKMDLIGKGMWMGKPPYTKNNPELYIINEFEACDIDYEWQFDLYTSYWEKING